MSKEIENPVLSETDMTRIGFSHMLELILRAAGRRHIAVISDMCVSRRAGP